MGAAGIDCVSDLERRREDLAHRHRQDNRGKRLGHHHFRGERSGIVPLDGQWEDLDLRAHRDRHRPRGEPRDAIHTLCGRGECVRQHGERRVQVGRWRSHIHQAFRRPPYVAGRPNRARNFAVESVEALYVRADGLRLGRERRKAARHLDHRRWRHGVDASGGIGCVLRLAMLVRHGDRGRSGHALDGLLWRLLDLQVGGQRDHVHQHRTIHSRRRARACLRPQDAGDGLRWQ